MRKATKVDKVPTPAPDVTVEEARRMLAYEPDTGLLRWKVERYRKHVGDVAGCVHACKSGYRRVTVSINYKRYLAHRVIWLIVKGVWPENEIDHEDNNGANNRWKNLRKATREQNGKNLKLKKNNKTGISGVSWCKKRQLFRARINVAHKEIFVGYFNNLEKAKNARNAATIKYHGDFGKLQ